VAALRDLSATKDVENARKLLNDDLGKFVSGLGTDNLQAVLLSVLDTSGDFHGHGFCATHDHDSQLPNGQQWTCAAYAESVFKFTRPASRTEAG
jgi:hypothetical protein